MAIRKSPPFLHRHKPSLQGVVTLDGRARYLGHWPDGRKTPPPDVQAAYDACIAEWLTHGRAGFSPPRCSPIPICSRDGTTTSEIGNFRLSLRPVRQLYGSLIATDFTSMNM